LRADDNPDVLHRRLVAYREQTAPLIVYYQAHGMLRTVDGMAPIAEVARQIEGALDDAGRTPKVQPAAKREPSPKPAIGKKSEIGNKPGKKRAGGKPKPAAGKRPAAKVGSALTSKGKRKAKSKLKSRGRLKAQPKARIKARAGKRRQGSCTRSR
jgi:adenylate kinase